MSQADEFARLAKLRDVLPAERRIRRTVGVMFADQFRLFERHLRQFAGRFSEGLVSARPASRLLSEALSDPEVDEIWAGVVAITASGAVVEIDRQGRRLVRAGATRTISDLGADLSFDLAWPEAVDYLAGRGAARVAGIDQETRRQVREILVRGAQEGWSYQQVAAELRGRFREFRARSPLAHIRTRAELIAVTEAGEAYEHGRRIVGDRLAGQAIPVEKRWLTVEDRRVCDICEAGSDSGWIDHHDLFANGLDGPLGHPGCRCTRLQRTAEGGADGEAAA